MRLVFSLLLVLSLLSPALALGLEQPSFTITPAKNEFTLAPGESVTKEIIVTNNLGRLTEFAVTVNDFKEVNSAYSLKNYLHLGSTKVVVASNQSATIPVTISLPQAIAPTGLYATINIATVPGSSGAGAKVSAALSSLFFVRVAGEAVPAGELISFGPIGGFWQMLKSEFNFHYSFRNTGTLYLNPYGTITLKRKVALGSEGELRVLPNFVLPAETRLREVKLITTAMCGWYEATLNLNRGYGDEIDTKSRNVFICNPQSAGLFTGSLIILLGALWWLVIKLRR